MPWALTLLRTRCITGSEIFSTRVVEFCLCAADDKIDLLFEFFGRSRTTRLNFERSLHLHHGGTSARCLTSSDQPGHQQIYSDISAIPFSSASCRLSRRHDQLPTRLIR